MQPFRKFLPFDARSTMAIRTTECRISLGSGLHRGGVADRGGRRSVRVPIDRRGPHSRPGPGNGSTGLTGSGDAVKATEEENSTANADHDCQRSDHRKDAHANLQSLDYRLSLQTKNGAGIGITGPLKGCISYGIPSRFLQCVLRPKVQWLVM